ncbi:MAG: hypothetical protein P8Z49_01025, partial [Acidobacteriota bacterium]
SLSANTDLRAARKLKANRSPKVCFQGQTPQHTPGFVLSPEQAEKLIDADSRAANVIHPFLIGEELNGDGKPSRFVIDIDAADVMQAEVAAGEAVMEHLRGTVLPDRKAGAEREEKKNEDLLVLR